MTALRPYLRDWPRAELEAELRRYKASPFLPSEAAAAAAGTEGGAAGDTGELLDEAGEGDEEEEEEEEEAAVGGGAWEGPTAEQRALVVRTHAAPQPTCSGRPLAGGND
jgi:hypothetical protein